MGEKSSKASGGNASGRPRIPNAQLRGTMGVSRNFITRPPGARGMAAGR